ncbi:MAG TPA: sigma factor-like helix-turn-helix DNA-binding protein, partial [Bacteroidia bacterium]|nr:sigma factor-like helix-turn-helix DNA-binding protein [Bacteroidia bacterium]
YAHLPTLPEAIESINEQQRICIQLFYLEKKSYMEISTQTGYDLNQVKSFIQNGKRNLKNYLLNKKNESR